MRSQKILDITNQYSAPNYLPLPIVIAKAEGVWVTDPEGNKYMDMLSSYSALNQGHRHPKIIQAVKDQLDRVTLTSRAFHNDQLGPFCKKVAELTGKEKVLIMNTGAEAVETAIKGARRWAYDIKAVPDDKAEIIVCEGNFHGRTTTVISFSSTPDYYRGFGPLTPGFKIIPYGDIEALKAAITPNTAAFLVEPIQGEAGVVVPPEGTPSSCRNLQGTQCPAHGRRNPDGLRPHRQTLLLHVGRCRPRCIHYGQGYGWWGYTRFRSGCQQ